MLVRVARDRRLWRAINSKSRKNTTRKEGALDFKFLFQIKKIFLLAANLYSAPLV